MYSNDDRCDSIANGLNISVVMTGILLVLNFAILGKSIWRGLFSRFKRSLFILFFKKSLEVLKLLVNLENQYVKAV